MAGFYGFPRILLAFCGEFGQNRTMTHDNNDKTARITEGITDFPTLSGRIGDMLGHSDWVRIDQARIDSFADVTCDWQYIHINKARVRDEGEFDGTIAHGYLLLSMLTVLVGQAMPAIEGVKTFINYGLNRVRFVRPVVSGSEIRANVVLVSVREKRAGAWLVEAEVSVEVKGKDGGENAVAVVARCLTLYILND